METTVEGEVKRKKKKKPERSLVLIQAHKQSAYFYELDI